MRETQILREFGAARGSHRAPQGLRRGVAKLDGPGTTTSDSIPARLSKGEAVLPAKTVQAVGEHNLRRLITSTNGVPPAQGLRAGGRFTDGVIPGMETSEATMDDFRRAQQAQRLNTASGAGPTFRAGTGAENIASAADEAAAAARQSATSGVAGAKPAAPQPTSLVGRGLQGAKNVAGSAGEAVSGGLRKWGKGALSVLGAGLEGSAALQDVNTQGMTENDKSDRWKEAGARITGGLAGAAALAPIGQALIPVPFLGAGLGMIGGGYLGAEGVADLVNRATNGNGKPLASDKAAGLRAASEKASVATLNPSSPYGDGPDQTANTRFRTNFAPNDRALYVDDGTPDAVPKLWSGRGTSVPANTPAATLQPGNVDSRSRDFTAELNAAPTNLPVGLREGVIYKTVNPATGRVTYSGKNVGYNPDVPTQFVDGQGRNLARKGNSQTVSGDSPVVLGPNGSFVASPVGSAPSAEFQAAKQRSAQEAQGGLSAGQGGSPAGSAEFQAAKSPAVSAAEAQLTQALANGTLTRSGAGLLQSLIQNRTQVDANRMQHAASMYGHNVTNRGHELTYGSSQNRLQLDRSKIAHEMRQAAEKGVVDDADNSSLIVSVDKDGKQFKDEGKKNFLNQQIAAMAGRMTTPDGKPVSLAELRMRGDDSYQKLRSAAEAQIDMGNVLNEYAGGTMFGAKSGWAAPNITDVREMSLSDWPKAGAGFVDGALARAKPGYYSKGVEVDVGGRKQIIPIGKLLDSKYGGEHMNTINKWRIAHGYKPLGNMATGE